MRSTVRALLLVVLLHAWSGASPALAAWTHTWELLAERPVAGQPAQLVVRTWLLTGPLDRPNLWTPLALPPDFPLDVRLYRRDDFYDSCRPPGLPVALEQVDPRTWRASVVFPEPGAWVVAFCNAYYPMAIPGPVSQINPWRRIDVQVLPAPSVLPRSGGVGQLAAAAAITAVGAELALRFGARSPAARPPPAGHRSPTPGG
jgi:hypothetical protein